LTPSRSITGIALPNTGFVALYCSAILLPKGIAQLRSGHRGSSPAWAKNPPTILRQDCCRTAQQINQKFILRDQFQIALPPERKAIILRCKVGIGPVGVRP
jgi:hypothetical protein